MITVPVKNASGKEIDTIKLDETIFNDKILPSSIYQTINQFLANQRSGNAATKTRGEVSGGGKKPWRQKGTGRARIGSIRSPLWRHGGVVFGPHPRDFGYAIPRKMKTHALTYALVSKIKEGNLIVVDKVSVDQPKTKAFLEFLKNLKLEPSPKRLLLVEAAVDAAVNKAVRNIKFVDVQRASELNTYDLMTARTVLMTQDAFKAVVKRCKA